MAKSGVGTLAGAKFYIGTTLAVDYDQDDATVKTAADLDTFTQVKPIENYGRAGDTAGIVTFTPVESRREEQHKGTFRGGAHDFVFGHVLNDAGQALMEAAFLTDFDYNFKIELNDAGPGTDDTPTTFYWAGKVATWEEDFGDVESIVKRLARVTRNTRTVRIPGTST